MLDPTCFLAVHTTLRRCDGSKALALSLEWALGCAATSRYQSCVVTGCAADEERTFDVGDKRMWEADCLCRFRFMFRYVLHP
jgi:hypothetical protein